MDRQRTTSIKEKVLELCDEDDYGSWELWWAVIPENGATEDADFQEEFVDVMEDLVDERAIVPKTRNADQKLSPAPFSKQRLQEEIKNSSQPDPDRFYWFGLPER